MHLPDPNPHPLAAFALSLLSDYDESISHRRSSASSVRSLDSNYLSKLIPYSPRSIPGWVIAMIFVSALILVGVIALVVYMFKCQKPHPPLQPPEIALAST